MSQFTSSRRLTHRISERGWHWPWRVIRLGVVFLACSSLAGCESPLNASAERAARFELIKQQEQQIMPPLGEGAPPRQRALEGIGVGGVNWQGGTGGSASGSTAGGRGP